MEGPQTVALIVAACADAPDDMYTPYADVAIQPIANAPFPMPQLRAAELPAPAGSTSSTSAPSADGQTKNTAAFRPRCLPRPSRCARSQIIVPAGTWLTGPIQITTMIAPCDGINLQVDARRGDPVQYDFADYLPRCVRGWEGMDVMNYSPLVYFRGWQECRASPARAR